MEIRVLGCSGGIGQERRTTSLLVDKDILIDCGSGVGDLTMEEMACIRHIFLTHSHLDHIVFLPLMVDSIFEKIKPSIVIHSQPQTIQSLKEHIFNWHIWPDFAALPTAENPVMRYQEMLPGTTIDVDGRTIEMIPVNHIVPAVGYRFHEIKTGKTFAFTGDTTTNDTFWQALNQHKTLDLLIVESAFGNKDEELSNKAKHYCSNTLAADIKKLKHDPKIYLSHPKPGEENTIFNECTALFNGRNLTALKQGDRFKL